MRNYLVFLLGLTQFWCSAVYAGGGGSVMGNGGSTEITQVANNAQLAKTVAQNAQKIAVQITTATTAMNTYVTALQNLQHLPAVAIAKLLKPYKDQISDYSKLYKAVSGVYKSSKSLYDAYEERKREMVLLKKSPREYLESEAEYWKYNQGEKAKRLEEDLKTLGLFQDKAKELDEVQKTIPSTVTGNLSGLQMLNQQVAALRSENAAMTAAIVQQKMLMQEQAQQTAQKNQASAEQKSLVVKEQEDRAKNAKADNAVYKHPEFNFVW